MLNYLNLIKKILNDGVKKTNRTGVDSLSIFGYTLEFDLSDGYFPIITTRQINYNSCFAEMIGFINGFDNAELFRDLGTKIWDQNANKNSQWLNNTYRKGEDDLGRIYGVQARNWIGFKKSYDQLQTVVDKLINNIDDRRLLVTHYNPGELELMCLPPCHVMYQFNIENDKLNMSLYQRSADVPLGLPFNISGYSLLLCVISKITNHRPGRFIHFIGDAHIYTNQLDNCELQLSREPLTLPKLKIDHYIEDLDDIKSTDQFELIDYKYHDSIKYPFSV